MGKLGAVTIIWIGLMIAFVAFASAWFLQIDPNRQETANLNTYAEQLQAQANLLGSARKRVQKAEELVNQKAQQWKAVAITKTPPESAINVGAHGWQLVIDSRAFRNKIQRDVNQQMKRGGVIVVNGPRVPFPSEAPNGVLADFYNFPPFRFPVVVFDFGPVQVQGTYKQITDNIRAWSSMPNYLAVADGLQITGTTPNFTGTYNLTLVGYIRSKELFAPVPEGGGGGTGGGGGGRGPGL